MGTSITQTIQFSSLLPSNLNRSTVTHSLVSSFGLLSPPSKIRVLKPTGATYAELSAYHTREYLDYILDPSNASKSELSEVGVQFGLEDDTPPFPQLPTYIRLVAGASLTAARAIKLDVADVAICWDGGRHHAQKSHASGFCYVADCVLDILALKRPHTPLSSPLSIGDGSGINPIKPRILYLDLDLHFSDGVSQAFYSTAAAAPQVMTLSIHHASPGFFPASSLSALPSCPLTSPTTLSIPLHAGASNRTFNRIWPIIHRVHNTFKPDYIVVQCGVDGLAGDPCGIWNWGLGAYDHSSEEKGASSYGEPEKGSFGWYVSQILEWPGKKLFLGGGGYNTPNAARAWAYLTSVITEQPLSSSIPIPDHTFFPLYGPSFTLDVLQGNMQDLNTDVYLCEVERCFENVLKVLGERVDVDEK